MKIKLNIIIVFLLLSITLISACEPGAFFSPTLTPTPTHTSTLTPTFTPTSSLTPTITPSPTLTPTPTDTPKIPDPKNYRVIQFPMRWTEARDYCKTLDAHLVVIESKIENDFVYQLNPNTWVGLTDETQEGEWLSVTGEPVIYTNWTYSEPDNCAHGCGGRPAYSSEEDYAHFEVNSHQWGDWAFEKTSFVCEWESPK